MKFEGICVPVITTFAADLSVDFDAWGEVLDWQIVNGTHGIIVGGSTGEFASLSVAERIEQLRFARQRVGDRATLLAGINHLQADRCYELAAAARDAGADALLVAAPPYSLPSQDEIFEHCRRIDAAADLPIMLYNYPDRVGVNMDEAFLDRVSEISNVVAIKESSGNLDRIHLLAGQYPELQLSAGAEDQVLEFFAWGARSWVSVIANFFPRYAIRFYQLCAVDGDFVTGRKVMRALMPLMHCLERGGKFLQCVKLACEVLERPGGPCRPPMLALTAELTGQVREIVLAADTALSDLLGNEP